MTDQLQNLNSPLLNGIQNLEENNEDLEEQQLDFLREPSDILQKAIKHFKQLHYVLVVYTGLKFLVALIIIIFLSGLPFCKQSKSEMNTQSCWGFMYMMPWIYCSSNMCFIQVLHSFLATLYYLKLLAIVNDTKSLLSLAQMLEQVILIEIPLHFNELDQQSIIDLQREQQNQEIRQILGIDGEAEENKQTYVLADELKKKIFLFNKNINLVGKFLFIWFQVIQIFAALFIVYNYHTDFTQCYSAITIYITISTLAGIYQYFEQYIMTVLIIIFLPLLLFYSFYDWVSRCIKKRRERKRIGEAFNECAFSIQSQSFGDNECAICMQGYVVNQKIITLSCSEKHHFHSDCIISWLQVNNKCPLCRVVALENQ